VPDKTGPLGKAAARIEYLRTNQFLELYELIREFSDAELLAHQKPISPCKFSLESGIIVISIYERKLELLN
jgi:hypothetical protein